MQKYQNKYRIPSARCQKHNYARMGYYFITICTKNNEHYFGEIIQQNNTNKMILSNIGIIADILWHEIKNHTQIKIEQPAFIIMPNHIHGIISILGGDDNGDDGNTHDATPVQTGHALSLPGTNRFQNIGKNSISSIIGSYKSAVTKHANRLGLQFAWQTRFHDHIIRNQKSFDNIKNYIENNIEKWKIDKFNEMPPCTDRACHPCTDVACNVSTKKIK